MVKLVFLIYTLVRYNLALLFRLEPFRVSLKKSLSTPGFYFYVTGGGQNIHGNGPNVNQKDLKTSADHTNAEPPKVANQEGGVPLLLLNLPQEIFQEVQKIAQAGTPGATSVRISDTETKLPQTNNFYREIEVEAGFVCKKCRMAYQTETGLLAHQRNICYPGKLSESRGAVRLIASRYECKFCGPAFVCSSLQDFKRHCESETHVSKVGQQQSQQQRLLKPGFNQQTPQSPSSGLTHEMENVVNQITALAAQAAQENTNPPNQNVSQDSNANFTLKNPHCQQEPNKINMVNTHVPIHSSGH